jgi:hypothetical protein
VCSQGRVGQQRPEMGADTLQVVTAFQRWTIHPSAGEAALPTRVPVLRKTVRTQKGRVTATQPRSLEGHTEMGTDSLCWTPVLTEVE